MSLPYHNSHSTLRPLIRTALTARSCHQQAEKNRAAAAAAQAGNNARPNASGSMRLYVGSLHFNITEDMLKGIFEPFGKIDDIQLIMDSQTGRSRGYGFLTVRRGRRRRVAGYTAAGGRRCARGLRCGVLGGSLRRRGTVVL